MRVACSIAAALVALALAVGSSASSRPTLRVADEHPLAVSGSYFHPGEPVRLVVIGTFGQKSLRIRATVRGRFLARFAGLSGGPCVLRRVTAVGAHGSRAVLRLPPGACQPLGPGG
jgi:hypothetical protein